MRRALSVLTLALLAAAAAAAPPQAPTTREMALLCGQEFGELGPARIRTVLVRTRLWNRGRLRMQRPRRFFGSSFPDG